MIYRGILPLAAVFLGVLMNCAAQAAPDRFDNQVPDAVPDPENTYNFSYNHFVVNTEGAVTSERSSHDLLRFGYQFSDKLNASFHFASHDLSGGLGLTNPVFSSLDSAKSYGLRLDMNLLNEPAVAAGPDNNPAWTPGSAFSIGFLGNVNQLDRSGVGENETELGAYLAYSTDLTEEMRGHTYFSTSRLTGDNSSGSANRVGAGLDYLLMGGDRPLVLMANGIIDIYNFRQPQFNTSRISRFDLGLRYKLACEWDAQLGWSTFNDSEQDASGSGLFAGINWRNTKATCSCGECSDCLEKAEEAAPAEAAPPQAAMDQAALTAAANLKWDPADTPMMELDYPASYDRGQVEQGLHGSPELADSRVAASAEEPESLQKLPITGNDGIAIPLFPENDDNAPDSAASASELPREFDFPAEQASGAGSDSVIEDIEAPADNAPELQSFVPEATAADAHLARAPAVSAADRSNPEGITDACSRFLYLRLAGVPRMLLAHGGN